MTTADPVSSVADTELRNSFPNTQRIQKGCLAATVACSALALIPSARTAGSLSLRSVALLSTSTACQGRWANGSAFRRLTDVARIAMVAMGLVALSASRPYLVAASLVGDMAVQIMETLQDDYSTALQNLIIVAQT